MLKLIQLELKKNKIGGNILGGFIAVFLIFAFLVIVHLIDAFTDYEMIFSIARSFITVTFIIFASVLLSKFIIEEFKYKSISVLFMYPIHRKKLIAAKILIVLSFTFFFIVLANVLINVGFYIFYQFSSAVQVELTTDIVMKSLIQTLVSAVSSSFISLIPLYFGMRKYSVPATIVSSIIIATVLNSGNGSEFSLNSIVYIPIATAVIGALIGFMAIRNVERMDVI